MKKNLSTIILVLVLVVGLGLLLYPSVADWWNSFHQSRMIATYMESVTKIDDSEQKAMLADAQEYNKQLKERGFYFQALDEEETAKYNAQLNVSGTGIMGYVDIPNLKITLPIYHGTDEGVLQIATGHLEWSALPIGGIGTHTVISGHRGLPSARLFTDIDRLVVGDLFYLNVLGDTLTYEVDQINIVLPEEMNFLGPEPGEDLCTLVTCTPYGINSHRLLVRGHRVDTVQKTYIRVTPDAMQIRPAVVAPFVAAPILLLLFILLMTDRIRKPDEND